MKPTRFAAIVNPQSADGRTGREWPEIRSYFESQAGPITEYVTWAPQHATELARIAIRKGHEVLVAVGGDGTLNEVVNGFFENGNALNPAVALALIPRGTGSDFRRTISASLDPRQAVEEFRFASPRPIDLMLVRYRSHDGPERTRYAINIASFGMGGIVSSRAKRYSRHVGGSLAFMTATLLTSAVFRGRYVRLDLDASGRRDARILNVAAGNGQFHGAGMWICPKASLDDGLLDVTVVEYMSPLRIAKDMKVLYNGKIYTHPKVQFHRVSEIAATGPGDIFIEIDGEPLGKLPVEITVLPQALRLLFPLRAPQTEGP